MKTKVETNKVEAFLKDIGALIENTAKKNWLLADKFIDDLKSDCDRLDKIRNDYGLEKNTGFNILKSVAEKYRYENFHSEILAHILYPKTEEIGNLKYLNIFIGLIKKLSKRKEPEYNIYEYSENTQVKTEYPIEAKERDETEKGRIDIFIFDEAKGGKHGIIVENKINNAGDTSNQLLKYIHYVKKENFLIDAIVYIAPPDKQPPDEQSYTKYKEHWCELQCKMVVLPGISKDKHDLAHGFLEKCETWAKEKDDTKAAIFIADYMDLVKELGGDIMCSETRKEILVKLLTSEGRKVYKEIEAVWDDRVKIIGEAVFDELVKIKRPQGKSIEKVGEYITATIIDNVELQVWYEGKKNVKNINIGFVFSGKTLYKKDIKNQADNLLEKFLPSDKFSGINRNDDESWIYKTFSCNSPDNTFENIVKTIVENCKNLYDHAEFG